MEKKYGEIKTISQFADAMAKFPIGTFTGGAGKGGGGGGGLVSDLQLPLDVNDHYLHDRLDILTGQDFWRQISLQNAAASAPTTAKGDSMTVVNNTSMAGGQTTAVNTSIQTLVGTTDPHTQLAMAY